MDGDVRSDHLGEEDDEAEADDLKSEDSVAVEESAEEQ